MQPFRLHNGIMISLTIKGIPPDVYLRLKRRAKDERRSLNREAILCLERALGTEPLDVDAWLQEAARIRMRVKGPPLTDAQINAMKRRGRL
jgi:hypothetical protein